jgi:hypothetical protein
MFRVNCGLLSRSKETCLLGQESPADPRRSQPSAAADCAQSSAANTFRGEGEGRGLVKTGSINGRLGDGRLRAAKSAADIDAQLIPNDGDGGHLQAGGCDGRLISKGRQVNECPGRLYSDISDGRDIYNGRRPDGRELLGAGPRERAAHYASIQINPNFV